MNKETARVVSAAIGGTLMGIGIGYQVAVKRLSLQFEERLEKETEEIRVFYTAANNGRKKYATPQEAVEELVLPEVAGEALLQYQGEPPQKVSYHKIVKSEVVVEGDVSEEEEPKIEFPTVSENIFEAQRDANKPYIISQDMYMENQDDFDQSTLTYYEKGGTVADEREDVIEDYKTIIGTQFASMFGEGSSDENTVHVRNEYLRMEFEIVRSENSYEQDVMGVEENPVVRPSARQRREGQ